MNMLPRSKQLHCRLRKRDRRHQVSGLATKMHPPSPGGYGVAGKKHEEIVVLVRTNAAQVELAAKAIAAMAPHYGHLEKAEAVNALVQIGMQVVARARRPRMHVDVSLPGLAYGMKARCEVVAIG